MNEKESLAWAYVVRSLTDEPPRSVFDWDDLERAIDYLSSRALKCLKANGYAAAGFTYGAILPIWSRKQIEDLLRDRV